MTSKLWLEAAQRVLSGGVGEILCPVNTDGVLEVDWIPFTAAPGGEYRLECPVCGARNFVLIRHDPDAHLSLNDNGLEIEEGID